MKRALVAVTLIAFFLFGGALAVLGVWALDGRAPTPTEVLTIPSAAFTGTPGSTPTVPPSPASQGYARTPSAGEGALPPAYAYDEWWTTEVVYGFTHAQPGYCTPAADIGLYVRDWFAVDLGREPSDGELAAVVAQIHAAEVAEGWCA